MTSLPEKGNATLATAYTLRVKVFASLYTDKIKRYLSYGQSSYISWDSKKELAARGGSLSNCFFILYLNYLSDEEGTL